MGEIKNWNTNALQLFSSLQSTKESAVVQTKIDEVKSQLQKITSMIHDLSKQSESGEDIGEIIETELASMDKAIEEAAARIEVNYFEHMCRHAIAIISLLHHTGFVIEIESFRFGHQIRGERKNSRRMHGPNEGNPRTGEKIAYSASGNRRTRQGYCIRYRIL